ncbi:hypothetical protein Plim_0253 [Planctopirus limnophila DSM 3776]|uniref:Uncharacterized protein n=1 Tax=Planctopirus limnophila (strain ATCC 43296 / DSM 3776 / IFAM 1008 / Mu 290) TaxID=521674 RepID=D5SNV0_PLAL2|nr:hypothetical protein [Planctopirus limnophila]ADG66105.1 hypothetical protein Plim_0253 [Planctopirus limnophila DSM 3776]
MKIDWLAASLVSKGRLVRPPLNPSKLTSEHLPDICLRMHLILDSIEFTRCEGRLINLEVFEPIDKLYSDLLHKTTNHLGDWMDCIERFGDYYELSGRDVIEVSPRSVSDQSYMFEQLSIDLVDGLTRK